MIWVLVWILGLIAFVVVCFRGHMRWFFLWMLTLVVMVVGGFAGHALMERAGYREFVEGAARVGWRVLAFAVAVLVADIAAMIVYTIRHGRSEDPRGTVVTENRPLMSLGSQLGRSKLKVLGSKSDFVTMESLVDGTATVGERMMVLGIITVFMSFLLVWVGLGLILMKELIVLVLIPVVPGLFVYYNMREAWQDYVKAKKKAAAGRLTGA